MRIRCLLLPLVIVAVHLFVQAAGADQPAASLSEGLSSPDPSRVDAGDRSTSSIFQTGTFQEAAADGCEAGCDDCGSAGCCGCGSGCGSGCRLFGVFAPSDHCFDDFISPMTNPVFFEDPRTLTEARYIFLHQRIPPALGADTFQVHAFQVRAALTDRWSLVANKNGFIVSQSPLADDGWSDLSMGLKYNLFADYYSQRLLSAGVAYEMPVGSTRALQGNGDGEFHLYLTGAMQVGQSWHWISAHGFRLASDTSESQMWYWSNHLDRKLLFNDLYGLLELNWYHWIRSGTGGIAGIEGGDLINLGSTGVAGKDIVTGAFGFKYKPSGNMEIGLAWEFPLTDERDLFDNRLTVDWILRY